MHGPLLRLKCPSTLFLIPFPRQLSTQHARTPHSKPSYRVSFDRGVVPGSSSSSNNNTSAVAAQPVNTSAVAPFTSLHGMQN